MAVTLPRSTACSTAALMLTLGLAGTAMGQVTWQHQNVFTAPDIGDDGTCAPGSNYCWQGTGYYLHPVFGRGDPQWIGFDALGRPILTARMGDGGWGPTYALSFIAMPSGPSTWSISNTGFENASSYKVPVHGSAVDPTGQIYAVTCTWSTVFFDWVSFLFHKSPGTVMLQDVMINYYQNSVKPQSAVVRPNRTGSGAHWAGATTIDFSGSICEQGRLYFDGTRIDVPGFNSNNWGQTVSYDMDVGPDGQGNVVAEFIDSGCDGAINPSGLFFWRTSAPTWLQIAPVDGGERGVKIAVDGLGIIHVFGARYSQSSGAGGPILHWTSADNGVTWSSVPEQVIPYLTFRDLYAVAASNAGTIGVAYWTSPTGQELRFVEKRCGTWTEYTGLGTAGTGGSSIKVAYDSQDRPHIAYFEKPAEPAPGTFKVVSATTALTASLNDPTPLQICPGAVISASVQATGGGTIAYQWQARLNGTGWFNLVNGSNPWDNGSGAAFDTTGASTATVTVTGLADAPEDFPLSGAISLRCVVSNACGSATSDSVVATLCPADYDCNGFPNGDDFDAFLVDFFYGNQAADVDGNTFVNGDDFDYLMERFYYGC